MIVSSDADSHLGDGPRCVERARNFRHQPNMLSGAVAHVRCGFEGVHHVIGGRYRAIGERLREPSEQVRVIGGWYRAFDRVHGVVAERERGFAEGERDLVSSDPL